MTRREAVKAAEVRLAASGVEEAEITAKYLFYFVTGLGQADLLFDGGLPFQEKQQAYFDKLVEERAKRIPLQYLTGMQEFMGLEFFVTPDVLIPRQDTERLVEEVLSCCSEKSVLDLCTGSGCIIISLAKFGNLTYACGCDLSEGALAVAKKNAKHCGVLVEFLQGDLFEPVNKTFDIIVSNPPYIKSEEIETLMPEVRCHEPRMALDGMADGLYFYKKIIAEASKYLKLGGQLFFEIGSRQAAEVTELLLGGGFGGIKVTKDYAGLDRVISAKKDNQK